MVFKIDLDRGVHYSTHPTTGMDVFMYLDRPGEYLTAHETPLSEDVAAAAGFPVEELRRKRIMRERLQSATDQIRRELEVAQEEKVVVTEREGFKIIDLGLGRHQMLGPDNEPMTKKQLTLQEANMLLDELAPLPEEAPATDATPEPSTDAK